MMLWVMGLDLRLRRRFEPQIDYGWMDADWVVVGVREGLMCGWYSLDVRC